jgi:hypothetical protein
VQAKVHSEQRALASRRSMRGARTALIEGHTREFMRKYDNIPTHAYTMVNIDRLTHTHTNTQYCTWQVTPCALVWRLSMHRAPCSDRESVRCRLGRWRVRYLYVYVYVYAYVYVCVCVCVWVCICICVCVCTCI